MKHVDEGYVIKQYQANYSTYDIAKELDTYPKKIERILKKNGIQIRSKSESQKLVLKHGKTKHPTKGRKRTESEKINISEGVHANWNQKTDAELEQISEQAKERWEQIPADKKREMRELAGKSLQKTCKDGSRAERCVYKRLKESGYEVVLHKKGLVEGKFEIDLFLPELKTIIEIDGPQHFLPLFGQDKLDEVIRLDSIKNGLLLSRGYCVIRVKYMLKSLSQKSARTLCELIEDNISKIENKFPPEGQRFIEVEIK